MVFPQIMNKYELKLQAKITRPLKIVTLRQRQYRCLKA